MELQDNEKKLLLDHDFDGIKELDNELPPWLMWVFYATIFWGAIYLVHYHVFDQGVLQTQEYQNEVAVFQSSQSQKAVPEMAVLEDEASLSKGKEIFVKMNCATCHGANGEGNQVGPNLTDEYWINGNSPTQIFTMIKEGKLSKGMTPYKNQLKDQEIELLMSYVLKKLVGSKPANPKAPQGDKVNQ